MQNILFIINHKAGDDKPTNLKDTIVDLSKQLKFKFHIYYLGDNPQQGIKSAIQQYEPAIVAAAGGDGTVNLVASIIKNTPIKLLIIPNGSANGMAKEFDMPAAADECIKLLQTGKTVTIDLLSINQNVSAHLADVGLNARIVKRFQLDRKRGLLTYAKHLFNEIFFIKSRNFLIETEEKTRKVKAVSLTFANATRYGTGAVINPEGKLNDGLFEICIIKPFAKIHLFSIAIKMFRNRLNYSAYFETISCKKATIRSKRRTLLQIDGEVIGRTKEINLICLPAALQVIIPANLNYPTLID
jgi:diacylglycerol kinase family enzyme